jgi:hypothetical protein
METTDTICSVVYTVDMRREGKKDMRIKPSLQPRERQREKINRGHMDEIIMISTRERKYTNAMNDPRVKTSLENPSGAFPHQNKRLAGWNIALGRTGREGIKSSSSHGWGHHNKKIVVNPYVVTGPLKVLPTTYIQRDS